MARARTPATAARGAARSTVLRPISSSGLHPKASHAAARTRMFNLSGHCVTNRYTCVADRFTPRSTNNGCRSVVENRPR